MKLDKTLTLIILLILIACCNKKLLHAQTNTKNVHEETKQSARQLNIEFGFDLVSRYVWRGLDIGTSPNIQPFFSLGIVGFEVGFWSSYTLSNQECSSDELDFYLSYNLSMSKGDLSLIVTDYYFPNAGLKIGNFNNHNNADGIGAHLIEFAIGFSGNQGFPINLLAAVNIYNDSGNNIYFETGYSSSIKDITISYFVGGAFGSNKNPNYYGTNSFSLINLGFTASKIIIITNNFSIPVFASYVLNPNTEKSNLILGISL